MKLYIKDLSKSDVITLTGLELSDKVRLLKTAIERKTRIPVYGQKLFFDGQELQYGKQLGIYQIQDESTIYLAKANDLKMEIYVKRLTGKIFSISVYPTDTIENLKKKIQAKEDVPPNLQSLLFEGRQLGDDKQIYEFDICNGSNIYMVLNIRGG